MQGIKKVAKVIGSTCILKTVSFNFFFDNARCSKTFNILLLFLKSYKKNNYIVILKNRISSSKNNNNNKNDLKNLLLLLKKNKYVQIKISNKLDVHDFYTLYIVKLIIYNLIYL